jgi:SSS family solute:Na+ symporter
MISHYPGLQVTVALLCTILLVWLAMRPGRPKSGIAAPPRKSLEEYLVMRREATVQEVGLSYSATMVSALVFVGLPGLFYTHGVGSWLYFCLPVIFGVSTLFWFGSRISIISRESGAQSPFDAMNYIYGSRWIGVVAFILTAIFVIPVVAMQLVAIGRLLEPAGIPYEVSILILILCFLIYTVFAGMRADVRTDVYQGYVMVFGMVFVLGFATWALLKSGGSIVSAAQANPAHYSLPGPRSLFAMPNTISLAIMLASLPLMHGHYIMRAMIAEKDEYVGKSMWIAGLVIFLLYICAAGIGLIGLAVVPGLASGDLVSGELLQMAEEPLGQLGGVIGGVILAAVLAAALSSVDSQFLALGASAVRDVMDKGLRIKLSEWGQLLVIRLAMVFIGGCAVIMALDPPPLIVQLAVFATSGTMVLVPTFAGAVLLPQPPRSVYALASIGIGFLTFVALMFTGGVEGYGGWHPGVIAFAVAVVIYAVGALHRPLPERSTRAPVVEPDDDDAAVAI